jgi:hypothetical protein
MCDNPTPKAGMRVKVVRKIDRYPHFVAKVDMRGTVQEATDSLVSVKMDDKLQDAEEWDNCIMWYAGTTLEDFWGDVELIETRKCSEMNVVWD